jgi:hypothetical protein
MEMGVNACKNTRSAEQFKSIKGGETCPALFGTRQPRVREVTHCGQCAPAM